jgi:hypothetical protein
MHERPLCDVTLNLGIVERSRAVPQADLDLLIELYIAFFNRVPDADGLNYWIGQYQSGVPLVQICESFYTAAVQYSELTGYSTTMSNADFVRVIYRNVLGRTGATAPPDSDVQFWAGELASGRATKGSLVKTMLASAHSFQGNATWGWVTSLLDNKIAVGRQFAVVQGLNFNSASESITRAMAIAAAVTPTDTGAAVARIGITDTAYADNSKPVTLGLMRAAHMYSNYGDNVRGFKPSLTDVRQAATASSVSVGLSRSSFQDASGATLVFDTAVIRATGVRLAGGASHTAIQFTASRRADNGEMAYDFRPSSETTLAGISGFGGDVRLAVSADGRTVNQWELVKVRGRRARADRGIGDERARASGRRPGHRHQRAGQGISGADGDDDARRHPGGGPGLFQLPARPQHRLARADDTDLLRRPERPPRVREIPAAGQHRLRRELHL